MAMTTLQGWKVRRKAMTTLQGGEVTGLAMAIDMSRCLIVLRGSSCRRGGHAPVTRS